MKLGKIKVSAFEFAILQAADPELAKDYEPLTKREENELRKENLIRQARHMKILTPNRDGE